MPRPNMRLITPVNILLRRDFQPNPYSLLQPDNAVGDANNPKYLLDGEFLYVNGLKVQREGPNSSITGGALVNPTVSGSVAKIPTFAFWMERGRTDMQAVAGGKATVLYAAGWEADFSKEVLHPSDITAGFKVGDPLYINWLSDGTDRNRRRGLTKQRASGEGLIHAYVTRVYSPGSEYVIRAMIVAP